MIPLIKGVFLPEKIGTYYLFGKYTVSIVIHKTSISATKAYLKGDKTSIELIIEENIELDNTQENESASITKALNALFTKIGYYDEIKVILPSSMVIFKEIKLPFLDREKISMVINFEIEPLLPFSLKDAAIDFIIVKQSLTEKTSDLLITAVQKKSIERYITPFKDANIKVDTIIVDTISLYTMYNRIPEYSLQEGSVALVDIGLYSTRITLIINNDLKMIRNLPKGIITITKKAAHELHTSPNEVMEKLIRFGLEIGEPSDYTQQINAAAENLWDDINFTFTSFSSQILQGQQLLKVILLGDGSLIKGFLSSLSQKINLTCQEFSVDSVATIKNITIKKDCIITPLNLMSVSAVIESPLTTNYNLNPKEFSVPNDTLLITQLVVGILLTLGIFTALISHYSLQTKKLKKELQASHNEALNTLKNTFKDLEQEKQLSIALTTAQDEVDKQKETWFAFSNQSRASFLRYLLELTSIIDINSTGFDIEHLSLTEKEMIIKAKVRDYEALKVVRRELNQSKLFTYVESPETLQFTMKIILAPISEEL